MDSPPAILVSNPVVNLSVHQYLYPTSWTILLPTNTITSNQCGWTVRLTDSMNNSISKRNAWLQDNLVTFNSLKEGILVATTYARTFDGNELPITNVAYDVHIKERAELLISGLPLGTTYFVYQSETLIHPNWILPPSSPYTTNITNGATNIYIIENDSTNHLYFKVTLVPL